MLLLTIAQATPVHVWVLLAGLVALGLSQTRARTIGAARAAVLPAALAALSLAGVAASFGAGGPALTAWLVGIVAALIATPRLLPAPQVRWSAALETVHVAGSWLPLALIVGLFATRYAVGASLAMHPELALHTAFAVPVGVACGLFSGVFASRGLQMWRARGSAARADTATA
jgi:hypothetical protein